MIPIQPTQGYTGPALNRRDQKRNKPKKDRDTRRYIVTNGISKRQDVYAHSAWHAARIFFTKCRRLAQKPGLVFYVRRGMGGGLDEHEVWFFKHELFWSPLQVVHAEPVFEDGRVANGRLAPAGPKRKRKTKSTDWLPPQPMELLAEPEPVKPVVPAYSPLAPYDESRAMRDYADASGHCRLGAAPLGTPTDADPGSDDKIDVMCARYEQGLALFHPEDTCMTPNNPMTARGFCQELE